MIYASSLVASLLTYQADLDKVKKSENEHFQHEP